MGRVVGTALAAVLALTGLAVVPSSAQTENREPDKTEQNLIQRAEAKGPQRVLVEFSSKAKLKAMLGDFRKAADTFEVNHRFDRWPIVSGEVDAAALRQLTSSAAVTQVYRSTYSYLELDSATDTTNTPDVHQRGVTGAGQTVAVIDNGVDADHEFFGDRVVAEACFSNVAGADGQQSLCPNGEDTQTGDGAADPDVEGCRQGGENVCDHGTHVAGIAVGANPDAPSDSEPDTGVAPGAALIGVKIGSVDDEGDRAIATEDQLAAFEHVLNLAEGRDIAAVNFSIGGGTRTESCPEHPLAVAFADLREAGVAVIKSAGNDGEDGVTEPGCVPGAVAVANSTDDDQIAGDSNRGTLVDLFAPGSDVVSAVPGGYEQKSGTSMAAPHVTGAFALLSERFPNEGPDQLLRRLQDSGVPIEYSSGGEDYATPRIDLAEAIPAYPPADVSAGGPYQTDEGSPITLNGSGRNVDTFEWDFDNDGQYDDATGTSPRFDRVGQDGEYPIALRASGPGGSATDETTVTVRNVPPTVRFTVDSPTSDPKPENSTVNVTGRITDPGWLDELSGTITFGTGTGETVDLEGESSNEPPEAVFAFETSFDYGDNGDYTVEVCGRDDHETVCESEVVRLDNENPDPRIDKSEAVDTPEGPTIVTRKGEDVGLSATTTDPGSDDLHLAWFYGQGDGEEPDREVTSLVNPPSEDPARSPSVQPRSVTDQTDTSYEKACVYQVRHTASDDDGGAGEDDVYVVVQNKGLVKRTATLWYTEYLLGDVTELPRPTLECYLDISTHMSAVFGEQRTTETVEDAQDVLHPRLFDEPLNKLDRQLLAGWLNFAHGSFGIDEDIDTECNLHTDRTFERALREAESVRLNDDSGKEELREQINRLEALNLCNPLPG